MIEKLDFDLNFKKLTRIEGEISIIKVLGSVLSRQLVHPQGHVRFSNPVMNIYTKFLYITPFTQEVVLLAALVTIDINIEHKILGVRNWKY